MKPEITKEQAEAITYLRGLGRDDESILSYFGEYVRQCAVLNELSRVSLAAALINGYEIVMTPEEKIRDYYESNYAKHEKSKPFSGEDHYTTGVSQGIKRTLEHLGIKIEGVNVDREEADEDDAPF
ncbi:hypothetical protein [Niallia circulans]|uniref:hypothetical protein n=1 Tax=Niallia circulans TaxID=1397 RepID=UPI0026EE3EED|nr:hypothetical protein [Niallia circulans]